MEKWQITAILGIIIFLIAGFLPLVSITVMGVTVAGLSLFDAYGAVLSGAGAGGIPISTASVGILLTIILYPITVILGFVSIIKRKLAIIAGILGIICWIGAILFVSELSALAGAIGGGLAQVGYGYGIYIGFVGAIILLITHFIKPSAPAT